MVPPRRRGRASASAQYNLAVYARRKERGVDPDPDEAFRWCQRAAEREMPEAEMLLGDLCASGRGTVVDVDSARTWYTRAAAHGLAAARVKLTRLPPGLTRRRAEARPAGACASDR